MPKIHEKKKEKLSWFFFFWSMKHGSAWKYLLQFTHLSQLPLLRTTGMWKVCISAFRYPFLAHMSMCILLPCNLTGTNSGSPAIICIFTRLLYMEITWWNQSTHMFIERFVPLYWSAWMWPDTLLACIFIMSFGRGY